MKLFTAILLGTLITLSFGRNSVRTSDTTYIGNRVTVEVLSHTKAADDVIEQQRHDELLIVARRTATATWWMNTGTWILAIFAVVASVISWRTFLGTQEQSRKELRAYLHPLKFATVFPTIGKRVRIIVEIKNFGKTPASDVRVRSSICIDKRDANPNVSGEYSTVGSVGPEGQFAHYAEEPKTIFDGESNRRIFVTNDYAIFATGEIRYRDFAGTERVTKFQVISSRENLTDVKNSATGEVVKAMSCGISENADRNTST